MMRLSKVTIRRYRGVPGEVTIRFSDYNVLVGKNDSGKSIVLKAIDLFLNDTEALPDIQNCYSGANTCEVEMHFEAPDSPVTIDEAIPTSLVDEELVDACGILVLKKVWDTSKSKIIPEFYVWRKRYAEDDFLLMPEKELMALCKKKGIQTVKANGEEYNNVEKRVKLRECLAHATVDFKYDWEKLPTTGKGRGKCICDELRRVLPRFEYFHADSSLSESDTAIQKYFKELSTKILAEQGIATLEAHVKVGLGAVLGKITGKINQVMTGEQQVEPSITFNWANVVQTGFKSKADEAELPLRFRGDGFRRVTMMAYFEHLAEERLEEHQDIIFGFEEPETFLHPSGQEQLHEKLVGMAESGYQVVITTHSPVIVANSDRSKIVHIQGAGRDYVAHQDIHDFKGIVTDLGITPGNQFIEEFEKAKGLLLVEGPDDVSALNHVATVYKVNHVTEFTFSDLGIVLIPIGGCDSIKHWQALDILNDLGKPFYVVQDSDKDAPASASPRERTLTSLGLSRGSDFWVLRKRALENYINPSALRRLIPGIDIEYNDYTHMKNLCRSHEEAAKLGGKHVAEKHFCQQTLEELRESFKNDDGTSDEFQELLRSVTSKLAQ